MKIYRHTISLILILILTALLCSCAAQSSGTDTDIVKLTAGIDKDTVLLYVDKSPVTAEEYLYWTAQFMDSYYTYGNQADDNEFAWIDQMWDQGLKDAILNNIKNYNVPAVHAADYGYEPDEDELKEAVDMMVEDIEGSYGTEEEFSKYLRQMCISREGFRHIMEEYSWYSLLLEHLYGEGGEKEPADEEILKFAENEGYYLCKYIYLSTTGAYTDAAVEAVREKAETALDLIKSADDPEEYLTALISDTNWNEDTLESEDGFLSAGGSIDETFDAAVRALEPGELSDVIDDTENYGFYIIMRLPVKADMLRNTCCIYRFNDQIAKWNEDAEVEYTDDYSSIDFRQFYINLTDHRIKEFPDEPVTSVLD